MKKEKSPSKSSKKPYQSPRLVQYGTVKKLTQGTRSKGTETARKQT